jgi:hypothetical protein
MSLIIAAALILLHTQGLFRLSSDRQLFRLLCTSPVANLDFNYAGDGYSGGYCYGRRADI